MTAKLATLLGTMAFATFLLPSTANAQQRYQRPSTSPQQNILSRPTVSPYLNLLQGSPGGFQSFVRPFAQQGNAIRQNQRQIGSLQQSMNSMQSLQAPGSPNGGLRPTGHQVFYRNYSHYYPKAGR